MDFYKAFSKSGKKPQSILKIVIGFSVVLLVIWLFMVSKMDTTTVTQSVEPEVQERTMGLQQSLRATSAEAEKTGFSGSQEVSKKEAPELFQNAFVTFIIMVSLLGGAWVWIKKKGGGNGASKIKSRELDSHSMGDSSQLKFLEINEEIWVIGMSENGINLLHRYPKTEWKESNLQDESEGIGKANKVTKNGMFKGDFKSFLKLVSS